MRRLSIRDISIAGLIAALYTVLSLAFQPISFGVYQIRVAEALTVLPFLTGAAVPGLYIGCLLANILGNMGWLDIVVGPLLTLAAAVATRQISLLRNGRRTPLLAAVPLLLTWLGAVYLLSDFLLSLRTILGLLISAAAVLPIVFAARRKLTPDDDTPRDFFWTSVIVSLIIALFSVVFLRTSDDPYFIICGALLLLATVLGTAVLLWTRMTDRHPGLLLAPLPPVLFNAFGVAAYLAPIIGTGYWFAVQMIGVGQLIACYLLGLPLLIALRRRNIFS